MKEIESEVVARNEASDLPLAHSARHSVPYNVMWHSSEKNDVVEPATILGVASKLIACKALSTSLLS